MTFWDVSPARSPADGVRADLQGAGDGAPPLQQAATEVLVRQRRWAFLFVSADSGSEGTFYLLLQQRVCCLLPREGRFGTITKLLSPRGKWTRAFWSLVILGWKAARGFQIKVLVQEEPCFLLSLAWCSGPPSLIDEQVFLRRPGSEEAVRGWRDGRQGPHQEDEEKPVERCRKRGERTITLEGAVSTFSILWLN